MKQALEASAHMYVYASKKHEEHPDEGTNKAKNRARLKLYREALRVAADALEELKFLDGGVHRKKCAPAVEVLRMYVASLERIE